MKPAGEARFANVRKLMQIAAEFEPREGRDLRGLLDFLAFREEAADESAAATAAEDHDGVRIMSVHRAKGLEFGVVAVPHLDRSLLAGSWPPLLTFGRGERPPGRDAAAPARRALDQPLRPRGSCAKRRQEREPRRALRLFHVAATRARERLILSGVVREKPSRGGAVDLGDRADRRRLRDRPRRGLRRAGPGASAPPRARRQRFEPRRSPSASTSPPRNGRRSWSPGTRPAVEATERGRGRRRCSNAGRPRFPTARSPTRRSPPTRTAATASRWNASSASAGERGGAGPRRRGRCPRRGRSARARGRVVHALLEWSQANGWREPPAASWSRPTRPPRGSGDGEGLVDELLGAGPRLARLAAPGRADRRRAAGSGPRCRSCSASATPSCAARSTCWSSARARRRWSSTTRPTASTAPTPPRTPPRYEIQRAIYALAVAEALGAERGRGRLRLPRAPRGAGPQPRSALRRWRPAGSGWARRSPASATASSRSRRSERSWTSAAAVRPWAGCVPAG